MTGCRLVAARTLAVLVLIAGAAHGTPAIAQGSDDWRADWEVAPGFALAIDTEGFQFPTAIAFVPDPGPNPDDPLYFVTEIGGTVKVVTRDRTVHTFAQGFFHLQSVAELPDYRAESGLAAICLDPKSGFVFVSFAEEVEEGVLRNAIVRFATKPRTFAVSPTASTRIAPMLGSEVSARAHQVGPMVIRDGVLYVAVGDALRAWESRNVEAPLGKILRMTLDGQPLPDNPYATRPPGHEAVARDYVWASGLRNPFGLALAGGLLLASDNGPSVDRLVSVERGRDYAYDGTDWSMGTNALAVFAPSVGPAQMQWLARDDESFAPEYRGELFLAFAGSTQSAPGPGVRGDKSIVALPLDLAAGHATGAPRPVLRYRGANRQLLVGLAFAPDGLYVAPLFNVRGSSSAILRLRYAPAEAHPFVIDDTAPTSLLNSLGCVGCHVPYEGRRNPVPSLDPQRLVASVHERLSAPDYPRKVAAADALTTSPQKEFHDARRQVASASGKEQVRLWLKYRIFEPRFEDPSVLMPKQEVSLAQAEKLANYFVGAGWTAPTAAPQPAARRHDKSTDAWPTLRYRHVAAALVIGAVAGLAVALRLRRRA
jgi:glucose/arabinose dehydrogenase